MLKAVSCKQDFQKGDNIRHYAEQHAVQVAALSRETWFICTPAEQAIRNKMQTIGTPLKEWDVKINFGIKTGLNKAFIIDNATKERLVEEDPKSAEIIKPVLRGRDIKRYQANRAKLWLIDAHNGYSKVPAMDMDDYPSSAW